VTLAISLAIPVVLVFGYAYDVRHEYINRAELTWMMVGVRSTTLAIPLAFVMRDRRAFCKVLCPVSLVMKPGPACPDPHQTFRPDLHGMRHLHPALAPWTWTLCHISALERRLRVRSACCAMSARDDARPRPFSRQHPAIFNFRLDSPAFSIGCRHSNGDWAGMDDSKKAWRYLFLILLAFFVVTLLRTAWLARTLSSLSEPLTIFCTDMDCATMSVNGYRLIHIRFG